MLKIIFKLIGAIIIFLGVIMIYDARLITKKFFSFGDKNEATLGLKMLGTIIGCLGAAIVFALK